MWRGQASAPGTRAELCTLECLAAGAARGAACGAAAGGSAAAGGAASGTSAGRLLRRARSDASCCRSAELSADRRATMPASCVFCARSSPQRRSASSACCFLRCLDMYAESLRQGGRVRADQRRMESSLSPMGTHGLTRTHSSQPTFVSSLVRCNRSTTSGDWAPLRVLRSKAHAAKPVQSALGSRC